MMVSRIKKITVSVLSAVAMVAALVYSASFSAGVQAGILICLNRLIPSLFLFMVLSGFFMASGIGQKILFIFALPLSKICRITKQQATIFCFSLLGGFPIGAKLLSDSVKRKEIDRQTAERMLAYCVNCGPAFLISAVSVPIFHNRVVGVIVYFSQLLAATVIAILLGAKKSVVASEEKEPISVPSSLDYSTSFVQSVESAIRSMGIICGLVLIFSGCSAVMHELGILSALSNSLKMFMTEVEANALLLGLIDVTNGFNALLSKPSFLFFILVTGFGGLCVQLQIKAIIGDLRMKYFYLYRPLYLFFSWFFSMILIRFAGGEASVFHSQSQIVTKPFVVSPVFSVLLVFLSLSLLLSKKKSDIIENK